MNDFNEEQILSLKFDAEEFIDGIDDAIQVIGSLNDTIKTFRNDSSSVGSKLYSVFNSITNVLTVFSKHSDGILSNMLQGFTSFTKNVNSDINDLDFSKINDNLNTTSNSFSVFEELVRGIFIKLGSQITEFAEKKIKLLTVDQVMSGWEKYQTLVKKTQTMMATGAEDEEVTTALRQLAWYADETSYSLNDMVGNLSKFVSYGISVGDAATEIMGIDNAVAKAGSSIQQATSAQEAFARAFSMGFMSLQVWRHQLTTSGLITEDFKNKCIEAGLEVGTLYTDVNGKVRSVNKDLEVTATGMENTLTKAQWMTKDVMETMLKGYAASTKELEYIYQNTNLTTSEIMEAGKEFFDQYSLEAFQMGQEALTLEQSIESLFDALSTQWANVFTNIFGTYKDAKVLWTDLANWLNEIFVTPFYNLVDFTAGFKTTLEEDGGYLVKYRTLVEEECGIISNVFKDTSGTIQEALREGILNILRAISSYVTTFKLAWSSVFNDITIKQVGDLAGSFTRFTEKLILSDDQVVKLANNLANVFRILKIVKDIIFEVFSFIKNSVFPFIKNIFSYITPLLDKLSESLSNVLNKIQTFLKTTFGIDFKNTNIYKEFQKLNDTSGSLAKNIELIKKKLKEYREANPDIKATTDNLTDLEKKIQAINKLTTESSMFKLTNIDTKKLGFLTKELSETNGYLNEGATYLKQYTDKLDKLKDQGYSTYENLKELNDIVNKVNASLNKSYIFKDLENINWSNLTDDDIKKLKLYNNELKNSGVYASDFKVLGEEYKKKLKEIGEAGKVTSEDLQELNDILTKIADNKRYTANFEKSNKEIIALQYAINKLKSKDKINNEDLLVLEELYKRLEKSQKESYTTADTLSELSSIIQEIGTSSKLTAEDIDKISAALETVKEKTKELDEEEDELEKNRRLRNERAQRYSEALVEASELETDEEKIQFWSEFYKKESEIRREQLKEKREENKISKEANDLIDESLKSLESSSEYSSDIFENVENISEINSDISDSLNTVNSEMDELNSNSLETTKNIDDSSESVNKLTDSTNKLGSSINDVDKSISKSKTVEEIDEITTSSKEAESWASKLANGLKDVFSSNENNSSKKDISNDISELGDKLKDAYENAEKIESISNNKKLSDFITDWFGKIEVSKVNIVKILAGVTVFSLAVKTIYEEFGKIAKENPEIFNQASKNIVAMGFAILEVSASIALISASGYLFGGSEQAIQAVTKIFKLMRNTLFAEMIAISLFKIKYIEAASLVFVAMGFALLEASASIAIISKILSDNKNGEEAIKAVEDLLKEFRKILVQVTLLSKESSAATIVASSLLIISFSSFVGSLGLALYLIGKVSNDYSQAYIALLGIKDIINSIGICINALSVFSNVGNEKEIEAASLVVLAFSVVILAIGGALSVLTWVQNKYGAIKDDSFKYIQDILGKIKKTLSSMVVLASLFKNEDTFKNVEKVLLSFAASILAIGLAVSAITYVESISSKSNVKKATKSIRDIIEQLKDCVRSIIIFEGIFKKANLENIDELFYSLAVAVLAIGVSVSAITYVDSLNDDANVKKATKSIRDIIEQLKDCVRSIIIFNGIFKSNYNVLESTSDIFYSLAACILSIGVSVSAITYIQSKYGNVKESVNFVRSCIDEMKYLADSLIVFSSIFNKGSKYSPAIIDSISKTILALSAPILAIGATISIISYVDSKYGNTEPAMENLLLMLKEITKIAKVMAFTQSLFSGIDLPFGSMGKSSWLYQLGLALIEVSWAVGIVAKVYSQYGKTITDDTFESLKSIMIKLGEIGVALVVAGGFAGKLGGSAGSKSKSISYASKTLLAIGLALLEVSVSLGIVAGIRKLVGDPNEFKESTEFLEGAIWDLGFVGATLIAVAGKFQSKEGSIVKASGLILSIATALIEISVALGLVAYSYNKFGEDAIVNALYDIGVMLFAMGTLVATLMALADYFSQNNVAGKVAILSTGFIAIGTALVASAVAISAVAYVSSITNGLTTQAMYDLAAMITAMTVIILALNMIADNFQKTTGKVVVFAVVMNLLAVAMNVMASALDTVALVYNKYKWWTAAAATTLVVMIAGLAAIMTAMAAIGAKYEVEGPMMLASSVSILILTAALKPIVNALAIIAEIRDTYGKQETIWELVGIALACIAGLSAIIGALGMIGASKGALMPITELASSGAILIISIGLKYLAQALKEFEKVDWGMMGKAAAAIGGLAVVLGVLMTVAQHFALGAAIIYGGMLVIAAALYIVAAAFEKFADAWAIFKAADSVNGTVTIIQNTEEEYKVGGDSIYKAAKEAGLKGPVGLGDGINEGSAQAITDAKTLGTSISSAIEEGLGISADASSEASTFYKDGQYIVQGVIDGINSLDSDVVKTVEDFAKSIIDTFNETLDIHSPSGETEESGRNVVEGFNQGITDNKDTTNKTVTEYAKNDVIEPVVTEIDTETKQGGSIYKSGEKVTQSIGEGMKSEAEKPQFAKSFSGFFGGLIGNFMGTVVKASGIMDDIDFSEVIDTEKITNGVQEQINNAVSDINIDLNTEDIGKQITEQMSDIQISDINVDTESIERQLNESLTGLTIDSSNLQESISIDNEQLDISSMLQNTEIYASDSSGIADAITDSYVSELESEDVQNQVSKAASTIPENTIGSMQTTSSGRNVFDAAVDIAYILCDTYIQALEIKAPLIKEAFSTIISDSIDVASNLMSRIREVGYNIISGVANGMMNAYSRVKSFVGGICSGIKGVFTSFFNIHSPSKVMEDIGENIVDGFANGISKDSAIDAAQTFATAFNKELINSISIINDYINSDFEYNPRIVPIVDLDNVSSAKKYMDNNFSYKMSSMANSSFTYAKKSSLQSNTADIGNGTLNSGTSTVNFTQNNYSPKALDEIEIYRRTKGQLNMNSSFGF